MPRTQNAKSTVDAVGRKKPALIGKKSKLYSRPEKIDEGTILTDLAKKQWRIGPSIGTGGFGEIYSASRVPEKIHDYVVKCEPHGNGPLFVEMHFYMRNARLEDIQRFQREHSLKSLGMPYMVGNGSAEVNGQKHRFIVMPRYGVDIAHYFLANGGRLPEGTVYRLALQMIDVYEFIHSCGYVHADLKGANILLGCELEKGLNKKGGSAQAYLVDYGLASHYITKEFKPDPKKMHNGTIEYTSRDAHQGVATMRGDFEILGYNLIEWLGVQLPWVRNNLLKTPIKVQKAKDEFMLDVSTNLKTLFPNGTPVAIADFMKYVANMRYNETPDYNKCRKMFNNALKSMKIPNNGDLDLKFKAVPSNISPPTSKGRPVKRRKTPVLESSMEEVCASDDDDGDVRLVKTRKTKPVTNKVLKTVKVHKNTSPIRKAFVKPSPQKIASPLKVASTDSNKRTSPRTKQTNQSPGIAKSVSEVSSSIENNTPRIVSSSARSTPISANAKINFNPSVRISRLGGRPGKTIINDNLTPNLHANKTYEFNFELDVSMDANVVVNVKRKKKADAAQARTSSSKTSSYAKETDVHDSPVTRVKVRKLGSDQDAQSSRSPIVTMKKSKRVVSPR